MIEGKEIFDKLIDTYGDVTLTEVENGKWRNRKKSYLVKKLLAERHKIRRQDLGDYLDIPKGTLDWRFNKDSFSFDDLIIIAYACDYNIAFLDKVGNRNILINAIDWFTDYDDEVVERLKKLKGTDPIKKRSEYEKKKAELERMKEEYGFED